MKLIICGIFGVVLLAVLFAGCTGTPATPAPVTTVAATPTATAPAMVSIPLPPDLAGDWVLTTMATQNGTAVLIPTTKITLSFGSDGSVAGNGGCNNYFGSYNLTGETTPKGAGITIGPLGTTMMYCQDTADQERIYLYLLQDTMAYVVDGTQLTMTGKEQNVLIFQRPQH